VRVYFTKSGPDLAYYPSRNAIGEPDTLFTAIEYSAARAAEWLIVIDGPIYWSALVIGLMATSNAL